jgi:hypothetical protein
VKQGLLFGGVRPCWGLMEMKGSAKPREYLFRGLIILSTADCLEVVQGGAGFRRVAGRNGKLAKQLFLTGRPRNTGGSGLQSEKVVQDLTRDFRQSLSDVREPSRVAGEQIRRLKQSGLSVAFGC